jgi:hypothetical protein
LISDFCDGVVIETMTASPEYFAADFYQYAFIHGWLPPLLLFELARAKKIPSKEGTIA